MSLRNALLFNKKLKWLSIILTCAIVVTSYSIFTQHAINIHSSPSLHRLNSYMTKVSAANYDDEGHLQALFAADKIQHFSNTEHYEYNSPYVTLYTSQGDQWIISADNGTANKNFEAVKLLDHVTIAEQTQGQLPLLVDTSELKLSPKTRLAQTSQEVVLHQGKTCIKGRGLNFNWHQQSLQLLEQVNGILVDTTHDHQYHLQATTLTVSHQTKQTGQTITAIGNRAHFWLPAQNKTPKLDAWAKTIHYLPNEDKIILSGHAEVKRGQDFLSGDHIHYHLHQQSLESTGSSQQAVHIVVHKEPKT